MSISRTCALTLMIIFILSITGCGKFFADLRRDIDEPEAFSEELEPTPESEEVVSGGIWKERGYLSKNSPRMRRSPASDEGENIEPEMNIRTPTTVGQVQPPIKRIYKNGSRATKDDFVDQSQEEGSLWASSGQTNYFFTKNRIRSPGDLITLVVEADLLKDIGGAVKKSLSAKEKNLEVEALQTQIREKVQKQLEGMKKDSVPVSAAAPTRNNVVTTATTPEVKASPTPTALDAFNISVRPEMLEMNAEELEKHIPQASLSDVDIYQAIDIKSGDTMMGEIIERYPNGNYKVRTVKRVNYKRGPPRIISVVGIIKGTDISEDADTLNSGKLYEYRVETTR